MKFYEKKKKYKGSSPNSLTISDFSILSISFTAIPKNIWKFSRYFYNQLFHSDFETLTEEDD